MKQKLRSDYPVLFSVLRRINRVRLSVLGPMRRYQRVRKMVRDKLLVRAALARRPKLLAQLRTKKRLRVAFVVIHRAVWKLDTVFEAMLAHPDFEPFIVVAPQVNEDPAWAEAERQRCHAFFAQRGWLGEGDDASGAATSLSALKPDIVFLTNPHPLTTRAFYDEPLTRHLTCYVPYAIDVSQYGDNQIQYNRPFHNAVWKIFTPHRVSHAIFAQEQDLRGTNTVLTGYPAIEPLLPTKPPSQIKPVSPNAAPACDPWKAQDRKKIRIIWAPHHTIDSPELPYANFLRYADLFQALVETHRDTIQWAFKPHPLLRPKLAKRADWGPERTDAYFAFWRDHPATQLELGEYVDLFRESDAMIHDSGSFLGEYLYVDKPVMYLWSSPKVTSFFNEFGRAALNAAARGDSEADIRDFIDELLEGVDTSRERRAAFRAEFPQERDGKLPSERIVTELLRAWSAVDR